MMGLTSFCKASHKEINGRLKILGRDPFLTSGVDLRLPSYLPSSPSYQHRRQPALCPPSPPRTAPALCPPGELLACIRASPKAVCLPSLHCAGCNQDSAGAARGLRGQWCSHPGPESLLVVPRVLAFPWGVTGQQSRGAPGPT